MSSAHPDLDFKPEMPRRLDHGIGIVGAGGVVNYAHLPAYAQAGFKVVGITDKSRERAEKTASDHKIPKVYDSLQELVGDPEVEIVDIAVYPWETLNVGEEAIRAGKHILCQKPLADEYAKAANLVASPGKPDSRWPSTSRCVGRSASGGPSNFWTRDGSASPVMGRFKFTARRIGPCGRGCLPANAWKC